jgi:RimJ/RimL family protein N-acetyltransferase
MPSVWMPRAGVNNRPARAGNERSHDKARRRARNEQAILTSCAMNLPSAVRRAIVFMTATVARDRAADRGNFCASGGKCSGTMLRMTLARATDRIESTRLTLRRIAPADLLFFTRIHAVAEIVRYIGHGRPRSAQETEEWLQSTLASYEELELGQLAVVRKADGALLGRCGMSDLVVEAQPAPLSVPRAWFGRSQAPAGVAVVQERELGYTFDSASWGHGYATEAAQCVFAYARDVLHLDRVISVIHPENAPSLRVAGRCGVRRAGQVEVLGRTLGVHVWPI